MNAHLVRSDARQIPLRDESVDCVVTSPPYWGLRDYGNGAQLGLERTPEEYVTAMVGVFREVRRVLCPKGIAWLNLGDSYANDGKWGGETGGKQEYLPDSDRRRVGREKRITGLKPKDLVGIPWRVAFALQADGWWLRSDVVWSKPNPMPESITDRPTKAHEYVFLLAKSERYYYDADAIREPHLYGDHPRNGVLSIGPIQAPGQKAHVGITALRRTGGNGYGPNSLMNRDRVPEPRKKTAGAGPHAGGRRQAPEPGEAGAFHQLGRNKRSVWQIATKPYPSAHFATFPKELARICILAGCPAGGTVLDPFGGTGTVGEVAIEQGRNAVLCDLTYQDLAARRITNVQRPLLVNA